MLSRIFQDKKKLNLVLVIFYCLVLFELFGIYGLHVYSSGRPWNMLKNELVFDLGGILFALVGALLIINYKRGRKDYSYKRLPSLTRFFNIISVILAIIVITCFVFIVALFALDLYIFSGWATQ